MTKPVRLQLSRKRGFDLQSWSREVNCLPALKADRSTELGNPFRVTKTSSTSCGKTEDVWVVGSWNGPAMWIRPTESEALDISIRAYRAWVEMPESASAIAKARGYNLACFCKLDAPCHADVLLEIANREAAP